MVHIGLAKCEAVTVPPTTPTVICPLDNDLYVLILDWLPGETPAYTRPCPSRYFSLVFDPTH